MMLIKHHIIKYINNCSFVCHIGRYYVTTGTGGVVGGASGLSHPQRQALTSVTRYIKLPGPSPIDLV